MTYLLQEVNQHFSLISHDVGPGAERFIRLESKIRSLSLLHSRVTT